MRASIIQHCPSRPDRTASDPRRGAGGGAGEGYCMVAGTDEPSAEAAPSALGEGGPLCPRGG
jgi:hypothetical protein